MFGRRLFLHAIVVFFFPNFIQEKSNEAINDLIRRLKKDELLGKQNHFCYSTHYKMIICLKIRITSLHVHFIRNNSVSFVKPSMHYFLS